MVMVEAGQFWDRIAPKYTASPIRDMASYEITLAKTRAYLSPQDRVLEIGAGTGSTALLLAEDCREITATDISDKMLDVGRETAKTEGVENISFETRRAEDMPEGPFDAILAHNLLHLVEDLPGILAASFAALRPGGRLITKTFVKPRGGLYLEYRLMKLALPVMQWLGKAPYVGFHTEEAFQAAFVAAGFEVEEAGFYPKGQVRLYLVARKPA